MSKEWFSINDFDDFVDSARKLVFHCFDQANQNTDDGFIDAISNMNDEDLLELDTLLSHDESSIIVTNLAKKRKNKKNNESKYFINDKILMDIIEALNARMISNILNKLSNEGIIETAYDSSINDFVFWIKDNEKEKPETD